MDNRWWEYYALRYFVGTIVGAVIVAFLNLEPGSPFSGCIAILESWKESTFLGISLVAALGFVYCYIASFPVLTLHVVRAHLQRSVVETAPFSFIAALTLPVVVACLYFNQYLPLFASVIVAAVIGIQYGLIILAVLNKFSVIEQFYRNLSIVRAEAIPGKDKSSTPGFEYVISYRHLREHGNAFLIVLLEVVLAYALFHSPSQMFAIVFLFLWLLPATAVWCLGIVLESRLVSNPLK